MTEKGRHKTRIPHIRRPETKMAVPLFGVVAAELAREATKVFTLGQPLPLFEQAWIDHGGDLPAFAIAEAIHTLFSKIIPNDDLRRKISAGVTSALVLFAESPLNHTNWLFGQPEYADIPAGAVGIASWFFLRSYFETKYHQKIEQDKQRINTISHYMAQRYERVATSITKNVDAAALPDGITPQLINTYIALSLAHLMRQTNTAGITYQDDIVRGNNAAIEILQQKIIPTEILSASEENPMRNQFFLLLETTIRALEPLVTQQLLTTNDGTPVTLENIGQAAIQRLAHDIQKQEKKKRIKSGRRIRPNKIRR